MNPVETEPTGADGLQPRISSTGTSTGNWHQRRSVVHAVACLLFASARQARSPSESARLTCVYAAATSASVRPKGTNSTPARTAERSSPWSSRFSLCIRVRISHQFTELMNTSASEPNSKASSNAYTRSPLDSFKIIARTAEASRTILFTGRFLTPFL